MVVYLAALQDVPRELYEAAALDGAGPWQQFRNVTVPTVRATTLFLLVVNVIWSFQIFDVVYVMTNGGPGYDTSMLVTYAYDRGFGPSQPVRLRVHDRRGAVRAHAAADRRTAAAASLGGGGPVSGLAAGADLRGGRRW